MACGCEKKDDGKKCNDFTKAVINIENPETLTLFHKVVIPASMGDETVVPPAVGKYCNTLVYYEASEHSYLYSSDGIPTFVTGKDGKDGKDGADGKDGVIQYTAGTGIDITNDVISATGSATVSWGDIAGDLDDQTDLSNALGDKQDTLTAGANISIDANNEISATDTTYTAGSGLDLTGTEFSVDSSVVALKTDLPTKTSELSNDGSDGASTYVEADDLATVATSGSYNDLLNKPTIPTVNNATLTIQHNEETVQTFTANASSNKTANINATKRFKIAESGADFSRWVIALCRVSTTDNTTLNSYSIGTLSFHRDNGLSGAGEIEIAIDNRYSTAYATNVSYASNFPLLPQNADLDTAAGWRPCTFKYNDVWYGGIEVMIGTAVYGYMEFNGATNENVFGIKYYTTYKPISGTPAVIDNQEIYDSLMYDKWVHEKGKFYFDSVDVQSGTISKGSGQYTATLPNKTGTIAMTSDIPTVNNGTLTVTQNGTSKGTFTANQSGNATIALTDTTYSNFTGTDGVSAGTAGLVPAPATTDANAFLKGDGTWGNPPGTTYTAGTNIQINGSTISATDTTYSDFVGTDGITDGDNGLVPAPITSDVDKYLKSDGTWATVQSGGSNITMTNVDPGEGQPLAADNYIAVYGGSGQGGFSRYTANQSIPGSTSTTLLPGTTQTPDDGVSYTNGVVVIQKAGWWMLSATVGGAQSAAGYLTVEIVVNGVVVSSASGATTANYTHCRNVIWAGKLSIGDTVKVQVTAQSAMNITKRDRGVFSGVLVSAD